MNLEPADSGNALHFLDWTGLPRLAFADSLNELLKPAAAHVTMQDEWMPAGYNHPGKPKLSFVSDHFLSPTERHELQSWWLAHPVGANEPVWDAVCTCTIGGHRGLILIEGKAHCAEFDAGGKGLPARATHDSLDNHDHIRRAILQARAALKHSYPSVAISRDDHYPLSNRVAFAWKLASMGVPVILMFLGFTGDDGDPELGEPIHDDAHWHELMRSYMKPVLPERITEHPISCGKASLTILLRSRPALNPSPARKPQLASSVAPFTPLLPHPARFPAGYIARDHL